MSDTGKDNKERNREIASNESARQVTADIRVSVWAIAIAVIAGVAFLGWMWLRR